MSQDTLPSPFPIPSLTQYQYCHTTNIVPILAVLWYSVHWEGRILVHTLPIWPMNKTVCMMHNHNPRLALVRDEWVKGSGNQPVSSVLRRLSSSSS